MERTAWGLSWRQARAGEGQVSTCGCGRRYVRKEGGRWGGGGDLRNQDVSAWCDVQRASARPGAALFLFWHTRDSLSVSLSAPHTCTHRHTDTHLLCIYIARTVNFLPPSCPFHTFFFFLLHSFTQFFHWSFRQSPQLACERNGLIRTPYLFFLRD